jgi:hypothetical protein
VSGQSFLDQLAAIRERQGRDPLPDPRRIQGFEDGTPPVPDLVAERLAEATPRPAWEDFESDTPEPETHTPPPTFSRPMPASPLIPEPVQVPRSLDEVELMLVNNNATYRGRACVMTEREKAAVVTVVLQAIKRSIRDQLREVQALKPKRRTKATIVRQRKQR